MTNEQENRPLREGTPATPREGTPATPRENTPATPREGTSATPREGTPDVPREETQDVLDTSKLTSWVWEHMTKQKINDQESLKNPVGKGKWGAYTLVAVFAGILYGGSKEASASVSKDAEVMLKMGSTTDKREQYRLMRDAMEKRFIRVARGSLIGGVRFGLFTGTFYGIQNFLADVRCVPVYDVFNTVGAGTITIAAFSLTMPGSLARRARNMMLASVLGAGICIPLGWLQMKLMERANQEMVNSKSNSNVNEAGEIAEKQHGVGAAIDRLENRLQEK